MRPRARIAEEVGEPIPRFVDEPGEEARLQNRPALESSALTASCGATSTAFKPDCATWRGTC